MIERHIKSDHEVELLIQWMQAPANAKPVVPFDAQAKLDRLHQALRWLNEHMSVRKVWPMMHAKYKGQDGLKYSPATARRDVLDAQRVFRTLDSHDPKFWAGLMIDTLSERCDAAMRSKKDAEFARLSKELREWLRMAIELGREEYLGMTEPVAIDVVSDPAEAGFVELPNIEVDIRAFLERRAQKKTRPAMPATDAEFTENSGAHE